VAARHTRCWRCITCSPARALSELLDVETLALTNAGVKAVPKVKRVVLVGNKISPGNPSVNEGRHGRENLVGRAGMAARWQEGVAASLRMMRKPRVRATRAELFNEYGPCLILVDEWVAYARQLHDQGDLPAGSFETHFTFAQALTESAKLAKRCLLVISLPASDTTARLTRRRDVEVGGERGRAALDRLRNALGVWKPPGVRRVPEEGFEIVRDVSSSRSSRTSQFVARDTVARAFFNLYRTQHQEFPS
jgi:hypothetical protein